MELDRIFEEEIHKQLQEKLKKYENKIYLNNNDIVKELNITSTDNLRKQLSMGMYKGLYEEKTNPKESYRWNKFKFFKWYFDNQIRAMGEIC